MSLYELLQKKASKIWAIPLVRQVAITAGIVVGCSIYYYPIMKATFFPDHTPEHKALFDKENLYPIKVRRERELAAMNQGPKS
ncbi:hypothetical protein ElyMa_005288700 [Elysia marginata]|uniref:Uncharacterized protein n=1 Tax=Elysia marginata TaxID=1093978 RepID=A0AAV4JY16_9GAST|nr:hypothetical protein ElyMa_005288700 [Elysia marginata]